MRLKVFKLLQLCMSLSINDYCLSVTLRKVPFKKLCSLVLSLLQIALQR